MMKNMIASLAVIASTVGIAGGRPNLIYHCTFDSAAAITTPEVGAAGAVATDATFVDGVKGKALYIPAKKGVAEVPFANGLPAEKGRVEYWAKIVTDKTYYNMSEDPRFFLFAEKDTHGYLFFVEINFNNGHNMSGWYTFIGNRYFTTYNDILSRTYSDILSNPKEWHHHEIAWNTNGLASASDKIVSFSVDGVEKLSLAKSGLNPTSFKSAMDKCKMLYFPSPINGSFGGGNTAYTIDEFKIWDTDEDPDAFPAVSDVTAKQHYPWCGKIDIGYKVTGKSEGLKVVISVRDNDNDLTYSAKTFDVTPSAAAGTHTVVWNAGTDGVKKVSKNMVATVSLVVAD